MTRLSPSAFSHELQRESFFFITRSLFLSLCFITIPVQSAGNKAPDKTIRLFSHFFFGTRFFCHALH